jgi:hypothetical protein
MAVSAADVVEVVGFGLALADFSGWSRKLEGILDGVRTELFRSVRALPQNASGTLWEIIRLGMIAGALVMVFGLLYKGYGILWGGYSISLMEVITAALAAGLIIGFYQVVIFLFVGLPICAAVLAVWAILHVLHLPKRGVVGTAGFVVACATLLLRFVG